MEASQVAAESWPKEEKCAGKRIEKLVGRDEEEKLNARISLNQDVTYSEFKYTEINLSSQSTFKLNSSVTFFLYSLPLPFESKE